MRVALGIAYRGTAYHGWQSQPGGRTVQDHLERALVAVRRPRRVATVCAGRTDAGVHALNQVVHFDTAGRARADLLGARHQPLPARRHRRAVVPLRARRPSTRAPAPSGRRYAYVLLESPVRPALESRARRLDLPPARRRRDAGGRAALLIGEHDFSAFRSAECQAPTPVKTLRAHRDRAARRLLALRLRGRRLPAPHDPQHHGLPGRGRQRRRAPALAGRGAGRARPRRSRRRPLRPTACTSSARTTMPSMRIPERTPAMSTGCPEAAARSARAARAPASRSAACRGGGRRRGGRGRRRRGRLRVLCRAARAT